MCYETHLSGFKSAHVHRYMFFAIKTTRSSFKSSETNILHWPKNKSEEKLKTKFRISKMTFRLCMNIFGIALAFVIVTLSSRISEEIRKGEMLRTGVRLLHLFSFGTWMGMQFWVTFIAGEWRIFYQCISNRMHVEKWLFFPARLTGLHGV